MEVLLMICVGLLAGNARAQLTLSVNATPTTAGQNRHFSPTLTCDSNRHVYVVSVQYEFSKQLCTCLGRPVVDCSPYVTSSELDRFTAMCWTRSTCTVSFNVSSVSCNNTNYPSSQGYFTYFCADANRTLAIGQEGSWTGTSLTVGYSPSEPVSAPANVSWECSVEDWDCSSVNVNLLLFVRKDNFSFTDFSLPGYIDRVGEPAVYNHTETVVQTSFKIILTIMQGSLIRNAYFAVHAAQTVNLTCGRVSTSPAGTVPLLCAACQSSPCQAMASCVPSPGSFQCVCPAGFNSFDGLSCLDINECDVDPSACDDTAHCNNTEGSFYCYCDPGYSLTDNVIGCTDINECTGSPSPCHSHAHCNNTVGSFHCYCDPGYRLTDNGTGCLDINECSTTPTPCDVTAHCNNTEGSFHCLCDPGYSPTDNGTGCTVAAGPETLTKTQIILIGVFSALGFLCIVALVVCCVKKCRTSPAQQKVMESTIRMEAPTDKGHNNSSYAYTEVSLNRGSKASTNAAPLENSSEGQPDAVYGYDKLGQKRKPTVVKSGGVYGCLDVNPEGNTEGNTEGHTEGNSEGHTEGNTTGNTEGHSNNSCVYSQVSRDRKAPLAAPPLSDSADGRPDAVYDYDKLGQKKKPTGVQNVYGSLTGNTEGNTVITSL